VPNVLTPKLFVTLQWQSLRANSIRSANRRSSSALHCSSSSSISEPTRPLSCVSPADPQAPFCSHNPPSSCILRKCSRLDLELQHTDSVLLLASSVLSSAVLLSTLSAKRSARQSCSGVRACQIDTATVTVKLTICAVFFGVSILGAFFTLLLPEVKGRDPDEVDRLEREEGRARQMQAK